MFAILCFVLFFLFQLSHKDKTNSTLHAMKRNAHVEMKGVGRGLFITSNYATIVMVLIVGQLLQLSPSVYFFREA